MELLRLRERGQITISRALREQLGIGDHSMLLAYVEKGRLILEPIPEPRGDLLSIIGLLPSRGVVNPKDARREAQRQRAERWSERHGEASWLTGAQASSLRGGIGPIKSWFGRETETAIAAEPAGVGE
ncbi:hypothetical protein Tmar_0632 [Thermaerobacter marianensis DSM 12885]|uniref:SpoVT-AbrB domain-containing protein n=1 Tax=Thermaerobacter marianensis (strain ATCC 700841 / DSM 12885 / JCM 10246 / 7p75a) TaxID=644966 RepID=E6SHQ6_THEM7|nr:hypothetical protein [Thermaerobacter marianensis]ADU50753.1 hypothetical protein Tmar_0632 [Thermaerobacter marianensis DSM 12885]